MLSAGGSVLVTSCSDGLGARRRLASRQRRGHLRPRLSPNRIASEAQAPLGPARGVRLSCSRQKEAPLIRNLLASLVHARDSSHEVAAQRAALHPQLASLKAQARAQGFERLGTLGERIRFTAASAFVEVWANPQLSTFLSLLPPQGATSEAGYFLSTSFEDGTELLRFNKREILTRGRETLEVSPGKGSFSADLAAHAWRVEALVRGGTRPLPALSVAGRVAGVERFYGTHLVFLQLLLVTFPALLLLALATILPCLAAYLTGAALPAYAILGVSLVLALAGFLMGRSSQPELGASAGSPAEESAPPPRLAA